MINKMRYFRECLLVFLFTGSSLFQFACGLTENSQKDIDQEFTSEQRPTPSPSPITPPHSLASRYTRYTHSDADLFLRHFNIRASAGSGAPWTSWISDVTFTNPVGSVFSINITMDLPTININTYAINDATLAGTLGIPIGTEISEEDYFRLEPTKFHLVQAALRRGTVTQHFGVPHTTATNFFRTPTRAEEAEIRRIKALIDARVRNLNRVYLGRNGGTHNVNACLNSDHIADPHFSSSGGRNDGAYVHDNMYDQRIFRAVLEAIRDQNETNFVENIAQWITVFYTGDRLTLAQRDSAKEYLTPLYVTFYFRNLIERGNYLHYGLRCGHFH